MTDSGGFPSAYSRLAALAALLVAFVWQPTACGTDKASAKLFGEELSNTNGKVCVLIHTEEGADPAASAFAEYCANILQEGLLKAGFEVFDQQTLAVLMADEGMRLKLISDDPDVLAGLSKKYQADIYVRGSLTTDTKSIAGVGHEGVAVLTLRAIDMRNGAALGSFTSSRLGATLTPGPVRGTSLTARQEAVGRASHEAVSWLGIPSPYVDDMLRLNFSQAPGINVRKPRAIAFTADSRGLAIAEGKRVRVVDPVAGGPIATFSGRSNVASLTARHTTAELALGLEKGGVLLWDPSTDSSRLLKGCNGAALAIASSHDGKLVAAGDYKGYVHVWDAETGSLLHSLAAHVKRKGKTPRGVRAVGFVSGGDYVMSVGQDMTAKKYDVAGGSLALTISEAESIIDPDSKWSYLEIQAGAFNPQATVAAISVMNKDIDLQRNRMDVENYVVVRGIDGRGQRITIDVPDRSTRARTRPVQAMAFFPNSPRFLAIGGQDGRAELYDLAGSRSVWSEYLDGSITALAFSGNGNWLAFATPKQIVLKRQR